MRQRQPHRTQLREARLMAIEDPARNMQVGNGIAPVQKRPIAPTPHNGSQRYCGGAEEHSRDFCA